MLEEKYITIHLANDERELKFLTFKYRNNQDYYQILLLQHTYTFTNIKSNLKKETNKYLNYGFIQIIKIVIKKRRNNNDIFDK